MEEEIHRGIPAVTPGDGTGEGTAILYVFP
jgi:hypothetical protein